MQRVCFVAAVLLYYALHDGVCNGLTVTILAPLLYPSSVASVGGTVWATDVGHTRIVRLNGTTGALMQQMPAPFPLQALYSAIAVDASGNVFVTDGNRYPGRVFKYNRTGGLVDVWTTAKPQLLAPAQLTVDSMGNVYVCDSGNGRIAVFTNGGTLLRSLTANGALMQPRGIVLDSATNTLLVGDSGMYGVGNATIFRIGMRNDSVISTYNVSFAVPAALALDSSRNIYIADTRRSIIIKLDANGTVIRTLQASSALYQPTGITIDASGNVLIADNFNNRIVRLASNGTDITLPPATPQLGLLNCIAVNEYGIHVAVDSNLVRLNTQTGQLISSTFVNTNPPFTRSFGMTADKRGNFYIADPNVKRVIYLINNGSSLQGRTMIYNVSRPNTSFSEFFEPYGVAVDQDANVYAPDFFNARVVKLSPNNTLIAEIFNNTKPPMTRPWGVVRDSRGLIYVSDYRNGCIYQFSSSLQPLAVFTTDNPAMSGPTGLAVDNADNLVVADTMNSRILVFSPSGKLFSILTTTNMYQPAGVAVDARTNSIIVADRAQSRILVFAQWNVTDTHSTAASTRTQAA